ncbi:putative ABC transport system ATP-binding protein [Jiangella alkaliphila]|uniref:Putative ABC transport system ATP-binding protein n=2 Tax=Jiangella alkaliphila TaxID=419479 RepID=A0A1H2L8F5_9ACTN|nr:putative ABC transport system ATP-binding protein [Jiangella alkaliphila]
MDTTAVQVRRLVRVYGDHQRGVRALDGVDLDFARGSFTAVMGPSGSGKSTLLSCIAGLDRPTEGDVLVDGDNVTFWAEDARTQLRRERIGFVFQSFHLMPYLTAAQNVALPLRLAGRKADPKLVRTLLEQVGLAGRAGHLPAELSGGQQQRVAIARAFATSPAVVLADEPTGALDTATAKDILRLLRTAVTDLRQTIVMVTHDPVAASYADRVVFLVDGRVAGHMEHPTVDAVAGQLAQLDQLVAAAPAAPAVAR